MPNFIRRLIRSSKRRIKKGLRDQRTFNLYTAGRRLLAKDDYERVSVASIAGAAGVSVGAFYERFPTKDAFLAMVIHERFTLATQRAEETFEPRTWRRRKPAEIAHAVVEHSVSTLHGAGAGVVRAAMKRGHLDPAHLEPLMRYRAAVAEHAVGLLAHRVRGVRDPAFAVRAMVQMVQATALDALVQDQGPLRAGRRKMVDAMSATMIRSLGLDAKPAVDDLEAEAEGGEGEDAMMDMPVEDVVEVETLPVTPPPAAARRGGKEPQRRAGPIVAVKPAAPVNPKTIAVPKPAMPAAPVRQRRRI